MRGGKTGYLQSKRTASKPPNAPDTVTAEKYIAARMPNSFRLYQLHAITNELESTMKVEMLRRTMTGSK